MLGQKKFWSKKIKTPTKLGHIWVRNNWAIHDMKKSCQHKYCLYKCHGDIWNQRWSQEIFLIWTNVARTNITWTNVTVTVKIGSRWSQDLWWYFYGWVVGWEGGYLKMEIRLSQPQLRLKLSWVVLRLRQKARNMGYSQSRRVIFWRLHF